MGRCLNIPLLLLKVCVKAVLGPNRLAGIKKSTVPRRHTKWGRQRDGRCWRTKKGQEEIRRLSSRHCFAHVVFMGQLSTRRMWNAIIACVPPHCLSHMHVPTFKRMFFCLWSTPIGAACLSNFSQYSGMPSCKSFYVIQYSIWPWYYKVILSQMVGVKSRVTASEERVLTRSNRNQQKSFDFPAASCIIPVSRRFNERSNSII